MRPDALKALIDADLAGGLRPCCVTATVGTTSTTSVDPVPAIAAICRAHGVWLHVDAAYAGSAAHRAGAALGIRRLRAAPTRSSPTRTSG